MTIKLTSALILAFLVFPAGAAFAAGDVPSTNVDCGRGTCDVELAVVNDRGVPQTAYLPIPNPDTEEGRYHYITWQGRLEFNYSTDTYIKPAEWEGDQGPFSYPAPPGTNPATISNDTIGIQPGDVLLITRNLMSDAMSLNDPTLYPEGSGVSFTVPAGGFTGQVTLPSFDLPPSAPGLSDIERGLLGKINDERAKLGVARLLTAPSLNAAADGYACWSGKHNPNLNGNAHTLVGTPYDRGLDYGWSVASYVGENLYSGPAFGSFEAWMGSPRHKSGMLDPSDSWIGVGTACGHTAIEMASNVDSQGDPITVDPFGGISTDVGDSSLYRSGGGDPCCSWRTFRFSPKLKLLKPRSKKPKLMVKNNRFADGKLTVKFRAAKKVTSFNKTFIRVRSSGRIKVTFKASSGSKIRSGRIIRCLKRRNGLSRISRCN